MTKEKLNNLITIFKSYPEIKLVYLFGSQVSGKIGPLSDYDFAIYCDIRDLKKLFDLKFKLQDKISRQLATDKVDLVILNAISSPELAYSIIQEGKLIYEIEPYRVMIEPRILNNYFDFHYELSRYDLTKATK